MRLSLQAFTDQLRQQFPYEAQHLRIRRANRNGSHVFQLVGELPDGRKIARQLAGGSPFEALEAAKRALPMLVAGVDLKGRTMPVGHLRELERACLHLIADNGNRLQEQRAKSTHLKRLTSWIEERGLPIQSGSLLAAIRDTDPCSRERRSRIQSTQLLARVAGVKLQIPKEDYYRAPRVPLAKTVSDDQVLVAYQQLKDNTHRDDVIWLVGVMILTGCRATTALTFNLEGVRDVGDTLAGWDSKRSRQVRTTPTIRGKWQEWNLSQRPAALDDVVMPANAPATDAEVFRANNKINDMLKTVSRKVSPEHWEMLKARSLRSATVARLLRAGMGTLRTAEIVSTSEEQVRARYSRFFKAEAIEEVSRLLS